MKLNRLYLAKIVSLLLIRRSDMIQPLPQIAAVSDMRLHQTEIIKKAKQAPVILMERGSKPALVCVSPEMWDALAKYIDDLECTVLTRQRS